MHYVVTGGCGFIGSHLAEHLLAQGHRVSVIDDLSTGKRENLPKGAELMVGDITTSGIFDDYVSRADGWFHLAAIASVQRSEEEWLRTHQVNLGGTVALFDALARGKRQVPVVIASSAAVYGDNSNLPLAETASCQPLSAYGADKLCGEWHAKLAASLHGIPAIALRFFNVYGLRQDPKSPYSGVISIFAERAKNKQKLSIYGDGEQTRDFIYISDVVAGLTSAMEHLQNKKLKHGVFNLCTGKQISVNALAQAIAKIAGSNAGIDYKPARLGDIRHSAGDPAVSKNILGFTAAVSLEAGLRHMMEAMKCAA